MVDAARYNRQELIQGWDQKKLADATVVIVGSEAVAQYAALSLVALGVGNVRILDNSRSTGETFLDVEITGRTRAHSLESVLKLVNPTVNVSGLGASLVNDASKYFLEGADVIIDLENDPRSKAISIDYAIDAKVPLIVGGAKANFGKVMLHNGAGREVKYLLHPFECAEQDGLVGMVLGGIVAEEVKKLLMKNEELLGMPLYYNLTSEDRFGFEFGKAIKNRELGEFMDKKVLLVGAGALGNFVGLGLANLGVGTIDVIDHDVVEEHNLNRQVLYYDAVGQNKAEALAKKISQIGRSLIESNGIVDKFTEKSKFKVKYDAIFDCVDNFTVRAIISAYAVAHGIPLISGGTDYKAGQAAVYVPGETSCLECKMHLSDMAKKEIEERSRAGCLLAPNPSVIMSNQIIGGMMTAEARTVFSPAKYGKPLNSILKYASNQETRIGIIPIAMKCGH